MNFTFYTAVRYIDGHVVILIFLPRIGSVELDITEPNASFRALWIEPDARGKGWGTTLLQACIMGSHAADRIGIGCLVRRENEQAISLYSKAGLMVCSRDEEDWWMNARTLAHTADINVALDKAIYQAAWMKELAATHAIAAIRAVIERHYVAVEGEELQDQTGRVIAKAIPCFDPPPPPPPFIRHGRTAEGAIPDCYPEHHLSHVEDCSHMHSVAHQLARDGVVARCAIPPFEPGQTVADADTEPADGARDETNQP